MNRLNRNGSSSEPSLRAPLAGNFGSDAVDADETGEVLDIREALDIREVLDIREAGEAGEAGEVGDVARVDGASPVVVLLDRDRDGDLADVCVRGGGMCAGN